MSTKKKQIEVGYGNVKKVSIGLDKRAFNVAAFSEFGEILSSSAISKIQHL